MSFEGNGRKTKFEVLNNAEKVLDELIKKQEDRINAKIRDADREDAVDFLKLLHIVKLNVVLSR